MGRGTSLNKNAKVLEDFVMVAGIWNKLPKTFKAELRKNKIFQENTEGVPITVILEKMRTEYNLPALADELQSHVQSYVDARNEANKTRGERIRASRAENRANGLTFGEKVAAPLNPDKPKKDAGSAPEPVVVSETVADEVGSRRRRAG